MRVTRMEIGGLPPQIIPLCDGFEETCSDASGKSSNLLMKLLGNEVGDTACGHRIAHRKWEETKLQRGTAGPGNRLGCCLVFFHFLWAILCPQAVDIISTVSIPQKV